MRASPNTSIHGFFSRANRCLLLFRWIFFCSFFIKVMFRRKKKNKEFARFSWIPEWIYLAIGTLFTFFARNYFVIVSHFYSDSWKWCRECETCMLVCIDMWAQQSCNIQNVPINIFAYQSKMAQKKNNKRTKYQTHTQNIVHHAQSTYCQSNGVTNNKATILHKWGQNVHKFYGFNATHPLHHHHPHGWWHGFYLDFIATFEPKLLPLFTVIHLFADCIAPMDIMTVCAQCSCGTIFHFTADIFMRCAAPTLTIMPKILP